ncbi:MAG TPA: hypothetical protein VMW35_10930 [Myxococcota bacterium]|nr:hypothetical protein [Myxococcota bacterium]
MKALRIAALLLLVASPARAAEPGCPGSAQPDPNILFCEDYEDPAPLSQRFVEYNPDGTSFVRAANVGVGGSYGMKATFQAGQVAAGWLIRSFGRAPSSFYPPQSHGKQDFREIYWREYVRTQAGWTGSPAKLSRVYIIAGPNWAQAMIGHLWNSPGSPNLYAEPASGIGTNNQLITTTYNDFANLRWLGGNNRIDPGWTGSGEGTTPVYATASSDRWFCVEAHTKLNTPGQHDGLIEFWVDDHHEAKIDGLNLVGTWQGYGINAVSLENYWNGGAPGVRERYRDNLIVSTQRIGCIGDRNPVTLGAPGKPTLVP